MRDYPDWQFPQFLAEQASAVYFADVFRLIEDNPVIDELVKRWVAAGQTWLCWGSVRVEGRLMVAGTTQVLGD